MALTINVYSYLLVFFCIFGLGAISGLFSEKVGIVNIGINGMMVVGAASYLVFTQVLAKTSGSNESSGWWQIPATIFASACAMLFSLLHGFATIKLKSDHTISGFAINLLAFGVAIILLEFFGNGNRKPIMGVIELKYAIPVTTSLKVEIISWKTIITLVIVAIGAFGLYKTKWGLRFRSIGENPQAADVAGINVNKYKWEGIAISGAIAGVSGAIFAQTFPSSFNGDVLGYGYLALAIMIMGQWNIFIVCGVSFAFSFLYGLSFTAGAFINSLVPYSALLQTTPYILSLIVIMITAKSSRAPAAAGIAYDKSTR
ncbi:sugar ABC transporter permease [Mycoplasmopsis californica HAZ160_1]|uniref:ABC transporter permease n=2 Tax=Mycoplasmopsis californica TaxID=2113 RepID=A0A059XRR9_9BACT|nr:ABC transporter permease [Mycoplasmopsis californica]AIA29508.1 ABC transporter permease [Mycoplasmopsis californica]BAP01048.1 sugar ABC transporter permease [Mycoplasmopsis californica HAZ160_1]BBG40913.1 sugar ABC transporter permease [Mycoplasmopsis californica]BBG41507.1 sugar ABC transporter permease [Mycoplasmopsis californica]BBG42100.1 sugar ABC transporter permease [Mycoplasmopsis californica]